jgi:hypothetical protein
LGSAWQVARLGDLETLLNEAAEEGWEPTIVTTRGNLNRLLVILRRRAERRSRDRSKTWP